MREEGLFRVTDSSTDAKLFIEKINRGSYTFLSGVACFHTQMIAH